MHRLITIFVSVSVAWSAAAQELGNASYGADLAGEVCSMCHAIGPEDTASPDPAAPPFSTIAAEPAIGRTALIVWFNQSHPTMPSLKLNDSEQDDLVAFILSLKP